MAGLSKAHAFAGSNFKGHAAQQRIRRLATDTRLAPRLVTRLIVAVAAAALQACAGTSPQSGVDTDSSADRQAAHAAHVLRAAALQNWTANGRLTVRLLADLTQDGAAQDRGVAARMRWKQAGERYRITLSNNLGQGLLQLAGEPGAVSLRTAEGDRFDAPDAETLLREQVGWSVPLGGLRYWVLGIADPSRPTTRREFDGQGRMKVLEQSGWRVEFLDYGGAQTSGAAFDGDLPARVSLSSERVRGSVTVSRWQL